MRRFFRIFAAKYAAFFDKKFRKRKNQAGTARHRGLRMP